MNHSCGYSLAVMATTMMAAAMVSPGMRMGVGMRGRMGMGAVVIGMMVVVVLIVMLIVMLVLVVLVVVLVIPMLIVVVVVVPVIGVVVVVPPVVPPIPDVVAGPPRGGGIAGIGGTRADAIGDAGLISGPPQLLDDGLGPLGIDDGGVQVPGGVGIGAKLYPQILRQG